MLKVISGGQRGVDQAGWRAAVAAGLATGGTMPRTFRTETEDGTGDESHPEFAALYGAVAHFSYRYPPRTRANVQDADQTVLLCHPRGTETPGERLTRVVCVACGIRPLLVVRGEDAPGVRVYDWLMETRPATLNVAGNRGSAFPGVGDWAEDVLREAFARYRREIT